MQIIKCKSILLLIFVLIIILAFNISDSRADEHKIIIKMATLAPNGSPWHEILKEMAMRWKEVSRGMVELRIYPDGTAGDEGAMVRKMRIGQLQGAMITNTGLASISPAINAAIIPLAADNYTKLDRFFTSLEQQYMDHYVEKNFVMLNLFDAGWVRFFVSHEDPSIESVQRSKLFVWAGDDRIVELWKNTGFNVVPLAITDILPALQTGMVNAFPCTAVMALASQWFALAPYMIDLPWAPLMGSIVICKRVWDKVPDALKSEFLKIADATGQKMKDEIRLLEAEAITVMQKRGLKILHPDEKQQDEWRKTIKSVWPKMRGDIVPEKWFDAALEAVKDN